MRHLFFASTCVLAMATPAFAQSQITTATTQPVKTSTIKAGTADDITITSTGSITTTSPVAVTIDSNNKVTNQGTISLSGVNGATGILANAGVTSGITNSGKITIDENYTPTDSDNDGDLDGPFALGSDRFGVRTLGAFTGNITNTGTITVEGNNSGGIVLGGPLTGNFSNDGAVNLLGNNGVAVLTGDVTGNVRYAGTIGATGQNSIAVRSAGDVTGAMVLQGTITATGYRYSTAPADPSKLDADDLLQGGPAVSIEGNVTKGIILAVPPKDENPNNADEDNDGIEDAKEGRAAITSYGSAAALRIGSATDTVTIGATAGTPTGFGLIVDGSVAGTGVYTGVDAHAVQIGGMGQAVSITNGIGVSGTITAKSADRAATAIHFGAGATTPELRNAGVINATTGSHASAIATAVRIDAGANLTTLRNSKEISAKSGVDGTAIAIVDKSGTLTLVENSGAISATGATGAGRNVAIDLSTNTTGATIKQTVVGASFNAPSIVGDVKFGSGSDLLDVADGSLTGNVSFGSGANRYALSGDAISRGTLTFGAGNDIMTLSGTSSHTGALDFGGGSDQLSISGTAVFGGQLTNASGAAVSVAGGTWNVVKNASIASLDVSGGGTLGVTLDKTAGASSSVTVAGTATFGDNSKLQLHVADVAQAEGNFTVLTAGTLVGGDKLTAATTTLPFLYKGTLSQSGNSVSVAIARKNAGELGLNRSESAAYAAIYKAIGTDQKIGGSFLGINDGDEFRSTLRQMLPDHAGGTFEAVTAGDRSFARLLSEPASPIAEDGKVRFWLQETALGSAKDLGDTAGFKIGGWGINGGAEMLTGIGAFGGSLQWLNGKNNDRATDNNVVGNEVGVAAHWRVRKGDFQALARAGWNRIGFDGKRYFHSDASGEMVEKTIESSWRGSLLSATAQASQTLWAGHSLYFRPSAGVDYYKLSEKAHDESGGGTALDLSIDARKSSELAVNALMEAGLQFGDEGDDTFFTVALEGGRRQLVGGSLGDTVAHFAGGDDFTLKPESRKSGWVGRLRGIGGGEGWKVSGELGAEQREDKTAFSGRIGVQFGL